MADEKFGEQYKEILERQEDDDTKALRILRLWNRGEWPTANTPIANQPWEKQVGYAKSYVRAYNEKQQDENENQQ